MRQLAQILIAAVLLGLAAAAAAGPLPIVQGEQEALRQDAGKYAVRHAVPLDEAERRLRAQQETVAVTDRIAAVLGHRLAGMSVEHEPQYRIVVLLTGNAPVANQAALAAGSPVPVVFQTGASATRLEIVAAMRAHQAALREAFPRSRGMGLDPRTGEMVLLVRGIDTDVIGAWRERAEAITGVPVRVVPVLGKPADMVRGGGRVVGRNPDGRRYACTTGYVVRSGSRTGVVTAAHCPDNLEYQEPDGSRVPLAFVGEWGARHQDVQVHETIAAHEPLFYADRRAGALRKVAGARSRTGTRAGDWVCHWGESSGYSCAEVGLTDFAPPGDLCAGLCEPVWLKVDSTDCMAGDSGGPVFSGSVAYGITKGGSGLEGECNFYFYMSTDYLPDGWALLRDDVPSPAADAPSPAVAARDMGGNGH